MKNVFATYIQEHERGEEKTGKKGKNTKGRQTFLDDFFCVLSCALNS